MKIIEQKNSLHFKKIIKKDEMPLPFSFSSKPQSAPKARMRTVGATSLQRSTTCYTVSSIVIELVIDVNLSK